MGESLNKINDAKLKSPYGGIAKEMNPDTQKLHAYNQIKLALADQLRIVRQSLSALGRGNAEEECSDLIVKLAEDRFTLAVLGQFKRGKSSLMNAIIGREILPTGVLPLTSAITVLKYGPKERLRITFTYSIFPDEQSVSELAGYVTEKENPGNEKKVKKVEVELPLPFLRYGLEFVDTPGVGSAFTSNTATTYNFLPECDAVIFVTGTDTPLTSLELKFLKEISGYVNRIFFVVNKTDLVKDEERKEVVEFVTETIRKQTGIKDIKIFAVSSRMGLDARTSGKAELYEQSGLKVLEDTLASFLSKEKSTAFLAAVAQKALRIIDNEAAQGVFEETALQSRTIAIKEEKPIRVHTSPHSAALAIAHVRTKLEALYKNISEGGMEADLEIKMHSVTESEINIAKTEMIETKTSGNNTSETLAKNILEDLQTRSCPVCQHITQQAFAFFAHWQYQISTEEKAQNEFAKELGFCPLHTWQLLSISSPYGASIGYAQLSQQVSYLLKKNKNQSSNGNWIKAMVHNSSNCRVCNLLQNFEKNYIQKLVETLDEASGKNQYSHSQGACLRHIGMMIDAASNDGIRDFLLSQAVQLFEQDAEEMRSFAMKNDALRRDLQNRNEVDAYRRAIISIVGDRDVCMPWSEDGEI